MDIQIPLNPATQQLLASVQNSSLSLKLNQQIEVKVLNSDILTNSLALQLGDKTLQVKVEQAVKVEQSVKPNDLPTDGSFLKLQVVKLTPTLEFKILSNALTGQKTAAPPLTSATSNNLNQPRQADQQAIKLILTTTTSAPATTPGIIPALLKPADPSTSGIPASRSASPVISNVQDPPKPISPAFGTELKLTSPVEIAKLVSSGQLLNVKIVATSPDAVRMQILSAPAAGNAPPGQPKQPLPGIPVPASTAVSAATVPVIAKPMTELISNTPVLTVALNQLKVSPTAIQSKPIAINTKATMPELQLNPGLKLELEVSQTGERFEFKILNPNDAALQTQKVTETLRQFLPQQIAPELLLNQLLQHLPDIRGNETIPEALHRIAQEIIQNLPEEHQLTNPRILKQSVTNSGIFLEAKLPQLLTEKPPEFQNDLKLNLLKLLVELKEQLSQPRNETITESKSAGELNVLKELQQKTEGSIAKLVLDQLSSLPKDDSAKQVWNLEIPFLNKQAADKIAIEIEQDQGHTADTPIPPSWSVTITITPPQLGTIHCKVTYIENSVNAYFRSENPQTLAMLETHLEQLRHQFEAVGLKPGFLNTQEGNFNKSIRQKIARQTLFIDKA